MIFKRIIRFLTFRMEENYFVGFGLTSNKIEFVDSGGVQSETCRAFIDGRFGKMNFEIKNCIVSLTSYYVLKKSL